MATICGLQLNACNPGYADRPAAWRVQQRAQPSRSLPSLLVQDEWLDFRQEHRLGRLQLLPGPDASAWPPAPPRPSNPEALVPIDEAEAKAGAAGGSGGSGSQAVSGSWAPEAEEGEGEEEGGSEEGSEEGRGGGSSGRGCGDGAPLEVDVLCGTLQVREDGGQGGG